MGWDNLSGDNSQVGEAAQAQKLSMQKLAQLHHRVFSTQDGEELLAYLTNTYLINNSTPLNAPNITYESGYHDGEAGVVRAIIHQINRAEEI